MNFSSSARLIAIGLATGDGAGKISSFLAMRPAPVIVRGMNAREKARLYHELGQLVRSGIPFRRAIETLARHTRGHTRSALAAVGRALEGGAPVPEALDAGAPFVAPLEAGIFAASERAGRLENGLAQASEYYRAIGDTRARMGSRAAYPLFVLHIGILALALPMLLAPDGGLDRFLKTVGVALAALWLAFLVAGVGTRALVSAAASNATIDRFLRSLPAFGSVRRGFSLSRFCSAYNLQLDAGVNVLASLEIAARASGSAVIRAAATDAIPAVRAGGKVGEALVSSGIFPEPFVRAFSVGEETGRLDQELQRLSDEYRLAALRRLEVLADWIPKLLYLAVLIYLGWRIVDSYQGQMRNLQQVIGD